MKNIKIDNKDVDFITFSKKKVSYFKGLITKTTNVYIKFRELDIISSSEINMCIKKIRELYDKCNGIESSLISSNTSKKDILEELQKLIMSFLSF